MPGILPGNYGMVTRRHCCVSVELKHTVRFSDPAKSANEWQARYAFSSFLHFLYHFHLDLIKILMCYYNRIFRYPTNRLIKKMVSLLQKYYEIAFTKLQLQLLHMLSICIYVII